MAAKEGWKARREHLRDGIPLHGDILAQLQAAGVEIG